MKRSCSVFWLFLSLALPLISSASGLIIVPQPPPFDETPVLPGPLHPPQPIPPRRFYPPPNHRFAPLQATYHKVNVQIKDQIAVTSVDQEFYNPNSQRVEGTFLFPVPKGAQINKFTMDIDGKQVEAELLNAEKARTLYEDIVRKMKDPALLEYAGRDLFKVRIFPIEPHGKKRITLSYSQVLKSDAGLVSYVYPLNTTTFSATPLKNISLKIDLDSKSSIKSIYSPTHNIEVRRQGSHKATIGYEASDVRPDTDFQLFFAPEEEEIGANLLVYKTAGEAGYFLCLVSPGVDVRNENIVSKDVIFVLDTSGSMAGKKLSQAKKALQFCVENLNDNDRFEIIRFATETESLFNELVRASKEHRSRAAEFIDGLKPIGGTAIDAALRKALSLRSGDSRRPRVIVFLTDGLPTVGNTDENQIVEGITKAGEGNARIFCFGIGSDVNTHLLDRIAEQTRAFSQYVLPEEDLEVKVSSFFTRIKEPVLANLRVSFPTSARTSQLYPSPLPDLFKGEQLLLVGRYSGHGSGKLEIEGTVNGADKRFAYELNFPNEANDHEFISRLWAIRRIGYLLDEIRLHGENNEVRDEATDLARKFGVVTPYTAYLIIEDESRRNVPEIVQSLPSLSRDRAARGQANEAWQLFRQQKVGDSAVAGARYGLVLKSATQSSDAISLGNEEGQRALNAAPMAAGIAGAGLPKQLPAHPVSGVGASKRQFARYDEQTRFINGRSFYHNGNQWIGADVQKAADAKHQRIQFGSAEYFDFVAKHSQVRSWLALGKNVQFVWKEIVYEIYE